MTVDREVLAAIIADAFGPAFVEVSSRPGFAPKVPVPYANMPEASKNIFRPVADAVIAKMGSWVRY